MSLLHTPSLPPTGELDWRDLHASVPRLAPRARGAPPPAAPGLLRAAPLPRPFAQSFALPPLGSALQAPPPPLYCCPYPCPYCTLPRLTTTPLPPPPSLLLPLPMSLLYTPSVDNSYTPQAPGAPPLSLAPPDARRPASAARPRAASVQARLGSQRDSYRCPARPSPRGVSLPCGACQGRPVSRTAPPAARCGCPLCASFLSALNPAPPPPRVAGPRAGSPPRTPPPRTARPRAPRGSPRARAEQQKLTFDCAARVKLARDGRPQRAAQGLPVRAAPCPLSHWVSESPRPAPPLSTRPVGAVGRRWMQGGSDAACPLSTRGGTRLVRSVRGKGGGRCGGAGSARRSRRGGAAAPGVD